MNNIEIREKAKSNILKSEIIHIDEWDCDVKVKQMSGKTYLDVTNMSLKDKNVDETRFLAYSIIYSICDLEDNPVFTKEDIDIVLGLSGDLFATLTNVVVNLNNLQGINSKNLKKTR